MIGKFLCWITRKHKRAKHGTSVVGSGLITTKCPRCQRERTVKVRLKKAKG